MAPSDGAAVVIVKFNDYQCPPCRQTYMEYKPIFAKWAKQAPGKVKFMTKDFALERECNACVSRTCTPAACEAAVAVRLAREKGKAEAMEEWIFANQPALTPASVKKAAATVGGVTDLDARYAATLDLVKADIAQGAQLKVDGTPTFFMNGMRLPGLRGRVLRRGHRLGTEAGRGAASNGPPRSKPRSSRRISRRVLAAAARIAPSMR